MSKLCLYVCTNGGINIYIIDTGESSVFLFVCLSVHRARKQASDTGHVFGDLRLKVKVTTEVRMAKKKISKFAYNSE